MDAGRGSGSATRREIATMLSMRMTISGVAWSPDFSGVGRLRTASELMTGLPRATEIASAGADLMVAPATPADLQKLATPVIVAGVAGAFGATAVELAGCGVLGTELAARAAAVEDGPATGDTPVPAAIQQTWLDESWLGGHLAAKPTVLRRGDAKPAAMQLVAEAVSLRDGASSIARETYLACQHNAFVHNDQVQTSKRRHARSRGPSLTEPPV
jgi:hypothetical protein